MNNSTYDLVILDSFIHTSLIREGDSMTRMTLQETESKNVTHADQVFSVLCRRLKRNINCLNIDITDEHSEFNMLSALQYILKNCKCNVISISAGIDCCDVNYRKQLYEICTALTKQGTTIVAGFSNMGRISYPAAFDCVVGVDMSLMCKRINDFETVYGSIVNIRGTCLEQTVIIAGQKFLCGGTSFIVPLIVAEIINNQLYNDINSIMSYFSRISVRTIEKGQTQFFPSYDFAINKAIVFPFNKEMRNLARNRELLDFEIVDFYEHKTRLTSFLVEIKNYETINWCDEFDTVILGHLQELSQAIKKDLLGYFIENIIAYKKNVVFCDNISDNICERLRQNHIKYYCASENKVADYSNRFGKLHNLSVPVVCILGTRPRQGKFTLQMELYKEFKHRGYEVGLLGSEPISKLLGADETVICGYGSTLLNNYDLVFDVNSKLFNIEELGKDVVLVSSQSQTIPAGYGNIGMYPLYQESILLGCLPDAVILCVTYNDDINYIRRTINYIESLVDTKVIAIRVFNFRHQGENIEYIPSEKLLKYKEELREQFKIDVWFCDENVNGIADAIISYLE